MGFALGSLTLLVLSLATSVVHLARFDHGPGRWVWFTVHVVGVAALDRGGRSHSGMPSGSGRRSR